jgi:hypothetical protein
MAEFGGVNVPEGIASLLLKDRKMQKEFNTDPAFPVEIGRALILYNARGEGTVVNGETQILEAIKNGYKYTAETVPDVAPTKDFEDTIYESSFFDNPIEDTLMNAVKQTKAEQKSRALNFENYDPVVGSTSGYEFHLMPRNLTRPFGLQQFGPMDTVRTYNPERDEYLPKPRPTLAERLMKQGE